MKEKEMTREAVYKRQLGGAEAALRRERQKVRDLQELARDLWGQLLNAYDPKEVGEFVERMDRLGVSR